VRYKKIEGGGLQKRKSDERKREKIWRMEEKRFETAARTSRQLSINVCSCIG